jgi:hypothetical protein
VDNGFSPAEIGFYEALLDRFPGLKARKGKTECDVRCTNPEHDDERPSLGVDLRRNGSGVKALLNCRSRGCGYEDILEGAGLTASDLRFGYGSANGHHPNGDKRPAGKVPGCTLQEYADLKGLPVGFLTGDEVALRDVHHRYYGVNVVEVPYPDETGEVVAVRYRTGLHKAPKGEDDTRFRWHPGDQPLPYGLHRLEEVSAAGYVLLAEGESDTHCLWFRGRPALGIPGAENWQPEWARYLDGIGEVFVLVEPGAAGADFWSAVRATAALEGRVAKVVFEYVR